MQTLKFDLRVSDLNLQLLDLSLCFSLVEVVLTLGEELLLRNREEVLIGKTEVALDLCDLLAQHVVLGLNRGEIVQTPGGLRFDREGVRLLHEDLRAHAVDGAPQSVWLRLLDVGQRQRIVDFVPARQGLCHYHIPLLAICWIRLSLGGGPGPFVLESLQVLVGQKINVDMV